MITTVYVKSYVIFFVRTVMLFIKYKLETFFNYCLCQIIFPRGRDQIIYVFVKIIGYTFYLRYPVAFWDSQKLPKENCLVLNVNKILKYLIMSNSN